MSTTKPPKGFIIERQAAPPIPKPEPIHTCIKPGWWKRWKLGLKQGAVIRCVVCNKVYELDYDYDNGYDWKITS